jgi:hypothetical protein
MHQAEKLSLQHKSRSANKVNTFEFYIWMQKRNANEFSGETWRLGRVSSISDENRKLRENFTCCCETNSPGNIIECFQKMSESEVFHTIYARLKFLACNCIRNHVFTSVWTFRQLLQILPKKPQKFLIMLHTIHFYCYLFCELRCISELNSWATNLPVFYTLSVVACKTLRRLD